ncbi:hypothetical protein L1049_026219 [Liquidambar formosana]|uniref:O-fucosyltransferase family protein n=1 Tax=Liquidambar formosana TaxID=63359 RepID=A0AAP0NEF4_LIQFO
MHGYSRLGTGGRSNGVAVTVPSPPSSPRFRHGRNKNVGSCGGVGGGGRRPKLHGFVERVMCILLSVVFRRRGVLLFAPLLYISGMLLYMGSLNFDVVVSSGGGGGEVSPLGSVYRSPQVFVKLWPYMQAEGNGSNNALMTAWHPKLRPGWKPCVSQSISQAELPKSNGFLIIEANGGLNQQRLSICDVVAVAGLLNATLVIPMFHLIVFGEIPDSQLLDLAKLQCNADQQISFKLEQEQGKLMLSSDVRTFELKFGDIFDEEFFINALKNNVNVIRELPGDVLQRFDNNISNIVNLRVKAWSSPTYYLEKVLPKLVQMGAVRIAPFSNRLAHAVPSTIQWLRCFANFEALRFSQPIRILAENMVDRMVKNSSQSEGKYVSVHLRFEEDMVAFSCCIYDGGEEEKHEMDIARERSWRGKFNKRGRIIRPGAIRMDGKCPLTPLEVGMMLRGMGFDNTTSVYVAAGTIYKAEKYMAPLRQLFPRLETKDTLASPEELAPFKGHSSRLAALDYTVCLYSEVFVTTQGGNFPHFLMGHRRYIYGGHAKTINPDKRKLAKLFDSPNISWDSFKRQMQDMLHRSDIKGSELRKPSGSLYTFPMPDCMRKQAEASNTTKLS